MSDLIAVYGTLKRGEGNFRVTERSNGKFVKESTTVDKYKMYGGWGFPRVVLDGNTSPIHVEVFEVDTLEHLDALEGHPDFFTRHQVKVHGVESKVWMYFHPPIPQGYEDLVVEDGYWVGR